MNRLIRYDSYKALKANTNRTSENEQLKNERNLTLKQLLERLRSNYLVEKEKQEKQVANFLKHS